MRENGKAKFLGFVFFFMSSAAVAAPTVVTVDSSRKRLLVNGEPFSIRGVNYTPIPAGARPGPPSSFNFFNHPEIYNVDFPLIKNMGANTFRVFDGAAATASALDAAYSNGLYVVMGYNIDTSFDITDGPTRTAIQNGFVTMVNSFKNHPAVLMWMVGNEVTLNTPSAAANKNQWYSLVNTCAGLAHAADPNHPVATAVSDAGPFTVEIGSAALFTDGDNPPNLDIWAVNLYRGASFGSAFMDFAARSNKPLYISEFGADAYNTVAGAEDESTQAFLETAQWGEIEENLSAEVSGKACVGGSVFEWSDGWWKGGLGAGGAGGDLAHDTAADWTNGNYPDTGMNEEWWGMVSISSGSISRRLRRNYYAFKNLWNPSAATSAPLFSSEVRNFPNPAAPGETTQIRFTLASPADNVKADILDGAFRKITSLPNAVESSGNVYSLSWDGRDDGGRLVPTGLYVCRVQVRSGGRDEVKFRRILVAR